MLLITEARNQLCHLSMVTFHLSMGQYKYDKECVQLKDAFLSYAIPLEVYTILELAWPS